MAAPRKVAVVKAPEPPQCWAHNGGGLRCELEAHDAATDHQHTVSWANDAVWVPALTQLGAAMIAAEATKVGAPPDAPVLEGEMDDPAPVPTTVRTCVLCSHRWHVNECPMTHNSPEGRIPCGCLTAA